MSSQIKIAIGSDHAGFKLKKHIIDVFEGLYHFLDLGPDSSSDSCDYPDFANSVAGSLASFQSDFGILICGSGIGMSIAANRNKFIRAALCFDDKSAVLAREHNNANVVCIGANFVGKQTAERIIRVFLNTNFSKEDRHLKRIDKIS